MASFDIPQSDVPALKSAFLNERFSPELLPFESELVLRVRQQLLFMQAEITERFRPEDSDSAVGSAESICRMEVLRIRFLLKSYLRCRLEKVEKYPIFYLSQAGLRNLLSGEELNYAEKYVDLLEKHFSEAFLGRLPANFKKLTDSSSEGDMVSAPQLHGYVFLRVVEDIGPFRPDNTSAVTVDLAAGELYVMRYSSIRGLLLEGRVELV